MEQWLELALIISVTEYEMISVTDYEIRVCLTHVPFFLNIQSSYGICRFITISHTWCFLTGNIFVQFWKVDLCASLPVLIDSSSTIIT